MKTDRNKIGYEALKRLNPGIGDAKKRNYLGAANEHRVVGDLLMRGFCVYRSCAPNASCDLVCFKDNGRPIKIEVKTGYYTLAGTTTHSKISSRDNFDVLAIVFYDKIVYQPSLESI